MICGVVGLGHGPASSSNLEPSNSLRQQTLSFKYFVQNENHLFRAVDYIRAFHNDTQGRAGSGVL